MKYIDKHKVFIILTLVLFIVAATISYIMNNAYKKQIVLELGIFSGSNWDVPNWQSYRIIDEAIARFEERNPGIKIKYRSGTLKDDYSEWLAQKIVKGTEPDIFCVLAGDFNTFASIGVMKNLDRLIKKDPDFDIDRMYVNAVKSGQFQGAQYALPNEVVPVLMFVNKTLLKEESIELPKDDWTWDDFYDICSKVTRDTDGDGRIDRFGSFGFTWQHAVYTNGQKLFDPDGNETYFNNQGVLESVKFIIKLNRLNQNFKVTADDFDNGKVAFRPFLFSTYRAYKPYPYRVKKYSQFEWDCIKLPKGHNGSNASELYSNLFSISSKTKCEQEAWEFLKFLTCDSTNQINVFKYSHGVPVLKYITESEEAKEDLVKDNPDEENIINMKMLSDVIEQSTVTPRFQKYEEAMGIADKELFQAVNGEKSPENTLAYLQRKINEFLKQ